MIKYVRLINMIDLKETVSVGHIDTAMTIDL
jgi:hypothetical protein